MPSVPAARLSRTPNHITAGLLRKPPFSWGLSKQRHACWCGFLNSPTAYQMHIRIPAHFPHSERSLTPFDPQWRAYP